MHSACAMLSEIYLPSVYCNKLCFRSSVSTCQRALANADAAAQSNKLQQAAHHTLSSARADNMRVKLSRGGDGDDNGRGRREDLPGTLMVRQGSCCALDDICGGRVGGLQKMEGGKEFKGAAKSVHSAGAVLPV